MNTYLRLLSFAKPFGALVPLYFLASLLTLFFGLSNFSLLIPLLNTLFGTVEPPTEQQLQDPAFSFSIDYLKDQFNYYFLQVVNEEGSVAALQFVCVLIVVSSIFKNIFRYLSDAILAVVRARVVKNLRSTIYDAVSVLHIGYFTEQRKGDLASRLTNDVQEVENSIVGSLTVILREPVTIVGFFTLLFIMSFKLTLFTLIFIPVTGLIIAKITQRLKHKAILGQHELGLIMSVVDETLTGFKVVKAFSAEGFLRKKFRKFNANYAKLIRSVYFQKDAASPISETMSVGILAGILLYGGTLVIRQESELEAGAFITYIILISQILVPAKSFSSALSNIQRGLAAGERIFEIVDTKPAIKEKPSPVQLKSFDRSLRFDRVSFAYQGGEDVVNSVSFEVSQGQTVALVGPSGGGKSTIADLIPRFYDPREGTISIDGHDIKNCSLASLRNLMGIVTQESVLFNDTIFHNIAFGNGDATEESVIKAAKVANAHDFIMQAPKGYQTVIGDMGVKLSGGQRQRLSIARAVLKNPPILILDEATSALDTESEKLVQQALTNLMKDRTSVVIAHRLSTIQHADKILVVEKGRVAEEGTHQELLKVPNGLYRKLSSMQQV